MTLNPTLTELAESQTLDEMLRRYGERDFIDVRSGQKWHVTLNAQYTEVSEFNGGSNYMIEKDGRLFLKLRKRGLFEIDNGYLIDVGDEKSLGFGFTFKTALSPQGKADKIYQIERGSNLDMMIETQVGISQLQEEETSAAYDLPSLITHDPGHHKVNFTWMESVNGGNIPNTKNETAANMVIDLLYTLLKDCGITNILYIGERASRWSSIQDRSRLSVTGESTRGRGQKMLKDVVERETTSEYSKKPRFKWLSYLSEKFPTSRIWNVDDPKYHMMSKKYLLSIIGGIVLILDDLAATRDTMKQISGIFAPDGNYPAAGIVRAVLDDLAYLPAVIRVDTPEPILSVFRERFSGVVMYAEEMVKKYGLPEFNYLKSAIPVAK